MDNRMQSYRESMIANDSNRQLLNLDGNTSHDF